MDIKLATFMGSWEREDQMKNGNRPEFAFIGRSNVGKSSLINMLCDKKGLAKTSQHPGKTQSLNLFEINKTYQFCDLPGYGYAKVSKKQREQFGLMISHYLKSRLNLYNLFLLIDMRIPMQDIDIDFINWCGKNQVPFCILGTKVDALKPNQITKKVEEIEEALFKEWDEIPPILISSAKTAQGKAEIMQYIELCLNNDVE